MSGKKDGSHYKLKAMCCGKTLEDTGTLLSCPDCSEPHFLRADYAAVKLEAGPLEEGLYRFSDWLPIQRELKGSASPVTYKSEALAAELGLENLWITFNGWWPAKGAAMKTGTFKECEAYSVCARIPDHTGKVLVVASAGNTARAFIRVCSENNIPLVVVVPEDNLNALWSDEGRADCVKIVASASGSDYFDAIALSNKVCSGEQFYPEGGAKNPARRDGMGTTVLSAATEMGRLPDYYFQAVGSGTGAIAAWEAALRLEADGSYGANTMKLMVSQNEPFQIIYDSWKADSRPLVELDDDAAREQAHIINAKVLSNRKPPYSLPGGLYDALKATGGDVILADNEEAASAGALFLEKEGIDISPAAAVAVASLVKAVKAGRVETDAAIMLNITGGGMELFKKEHTTGPSKADLVFSADADAADVIEQVGKLF
ncbi:MAG: cysteate synthase [Spirochaetales bacterium]|nr:cysteate synthase [Spirochaetales bacterium]